MSASFAKKAACPDGQAKVDFFDAQQKGFLLEVRSSGRKTYYQRYRDERGRERQFKVGRADVLTADQARRKARSVFARAVLGEDPQQRRQELRAIPVLADFVRDRYLPFIATYKRSWRTDETILRLHALPLLGKLALDEITPDHIVEVVTRMRERGYAAGTSNRVVVILRYLYNLAVKWRVPGVAANPTAGIEMGPEVQRSRFLTKEEAQGLVASIAADENVTAANAILLLLLTGGRRNEITQARWEHVRWKERKLYVPLSKSGKPRWIALSPAAMELLKQLPGRDVNTFIFPSAVTGRPSPSLWFPWRRIRDRANLSDVRLHDLRHSFASFLVNEGVSLYVVQHLLGHANTRTTQRYAHLVSETLAQATEIVDGIVAMPSALTAAVDPAPIR
ncbi:MAG: tyrosine-type recombinase/integrase [Proteobacteria bacterium]|nr:tyrosine-type recombinase/integrase [Pseudomonadota bacterium]